MWSTFAKGVLKHLEEPCCLLPSLLYQQWLCLGYGASWNAEGGGNKTFVNTYPQTATGDFLINCFTSISISYVESLTADDKASPKGWFSFTTESESESESTPIFSFHSNRSALTTSTPSLVKTSLKQIGEKDIPKWLILFFYSLVINCRQGPEEHLQ